MISRESRLTHRGHRSGIRTVFVPGVMAACVLCYTMLGVDTAEAIAIPVSLLATLVLSVIMYTRAEAHQRWEDAWDRYSDQDLSRKSFKSVEEEGTFSLV